MRAALRQRIDRLSAARAALEEGRDAEGATEIRAAVALDPALGIVHRAIDITIEFNLIHVARDLLQEGLARYPRDAKLKRWATVLAPPLVRPTSRMAVRGRSREDEMAWLRQHADEYRGQWVVLLGKELLGAGRDLKAALRRIQHRLADAPLVHFVRD
jgi:hypothetical protein